jgi:SAM-dependent methyltransferase
MRDLEHHEEIYSGFAQEHFAKPAVVAFRRHLVRRIIRLTQVGPNSRVLSLGSGIGDTELLLAPHAGRVLGLDVSPRGVAQARSSAAGQGIGNAEFVVGACEEAGLPPGSFDVVIAVFFLHHAAAHLESGLPESIFRLLAPGGRFYSLDPSCYRLSGFLGKLLVPSLMKRHQTEDEVQLRPSRTRRAFTRAGFVVTQRYYDFISTPLAGLFPSWKAGYLVSRAADEALVRIPLLNLLSSNFELIARKPL